MANGSVATTLILIRHADRDRPPPGVTDPVLNAKGRARAKKLVHVLGKSGIEAIYISHFIRSKETAQPLVARLGSISPTQMDEAVAIKNDVLANHKGKTVLVIGHSNTVPDLINLLSGGSMPEIDDREFDNLFVVTAFDANKASVTRLKYGEPT